MYNRKRTKKEWIEYLIENKILPIWREGVEGNIVFRRLVKSPFGTKHEFSSKQRLRAILELDIPSKKECDELRELVKSKIDEKK